MENMEPDQLAAVLSIHICIQWIIRLEICCCCKEALQSFFVLINYSCHIWFRTFFFFFFYDWIHGKWMKFVMANSASLAVQTAALILPSCMDYYSGLTHILLNPNLSFCWKHCGYRSACFWQSHLIRIHNVVHSENPGLHLEDEKWRRMWCII